MRVCDICKNPLEETKPFNGVFRWKEYMAGIATPLTHEAELCDKHSKLVWELIQELKKEENERSTLQESTKNRIS